MRVVRSLLHPDDLARLLESEYDLTAPVTVTLFRLGFNDTYAVTDAAGGRWVLRIYLREKYWIRSEADLRCELELLDYLHSAGRAVARPLRRRDGDLLGRNLDAPEGERCYAVFAFAPGRQADGKSFDLDLRFALGVEIARLHAAMDGFRPDDGRYHLDASILVDMPLAAFESCGDLARTPSYPELRALALRVKAYLVGLQLESTAYGLIHADIHLGNVMVQGDELILIDFDHCGFGWRAYDLTNLYEGPDQSPEAQQRWKSLLAGYESVRRMESRERDAIPVLTACRGLWDVGDWIRAADWHGASWDPAQLCKETLDRIRKPLAPLSW